MEREEIDAYVAALVDALEPRVRATVNPWERLGIVAPDPDEWATDLANRTLVALGIEEHH